MVDKLNRRGIEAYETCIVLVESGRLWQICIEEWLALYGFKTIPGMPQLFVLRDSNHHRVLILPIFWWTPLPRKLRINGEFFKEISQRFKIALKIINEPLIFSRKSIFQYKLNDDCVDIPAFISTIDDISLTRAGRKQLEQSARLMNFTAYKLSLVKLTNSGMEFFSCLFDYQSSLTACRWSSGISSDLSNKSLRKTKLDPFIFYRDPISPFSSSDFRA